MRKIVIATVLMLFANMLYGRDGVRVSVYEVPYGEVENVDPDNMGRIYSSVSGAKPTKVYKRKNARGYELRKDNVVVIMPTRGANQRDFEALLDIVSQYAKKLKGPNSVGISRTITSLKRM
ncbi:MAG: hypothetical protein IE916_00650 [Epsilonproteobacteria bacterium]|nr:hypothetical protein [Campylobacterota bacterium]